jgi:ABC-type antimicrobial peptide transport system permease subunit
MTMLLGVPNASDEIVLNVRRALELVPGAGPQPMTVRSMERFLIQTGLAPLRVAMVILRASAVTALLLSVLGLYGTLSDSARRQRRETAVRIALGATPRHVIGRVLGEGGRLAAAGTLAGMAGSLLISRLLSRIAMMDEAPPAWVWMAGPLLLAGMVAVASAIPARRSLLRSVMIWT